MDSKLRIIARYSNELATENLSCGNNLQYAELQPGENLLDLGCGRGSETIRAAREIGMGKAIGLDVTPKMVEAAGKAAAEQGVGNAHFVLGAIENLPFPDEHVDVVISNCAINHARDKYRVYSEIYRVLKPGGRFIVSDIMSEEALPEEITSDPQAVADCFGGAIITEEYFDAISRAGFSQIEILKERRYLKNGYDMISRTMRGLKQV